MDSDSPDAPRKRCPACTQWKDATEANFSRDKNRRDGLYPQCKVCVNAIRREQRAQARRNRPVPPPPPKEVLPEGYKRCRDCKEVKLATIEFFNAIPAYISEDCLNRQCKECRNKQRRERHKGEPKVIKPRGEKKWCPTCKQEWPATLTYFAYDKNRRDRLHFECKVCGNKRNKEYREKPGSEEARRAYRKATYSPEKRRMRRLARREEGMAYHQRYYATHKEQHRAYAQAYFAIEENRQAKRIRTLNRIARQKAVPGSYTPAQIAEQLKRQHYRCYYAACGFSKFPRVRGKGKWKYVYHIEHTFPLSRVVGTGIPANDMGYLVLSCDKCNESKGTKFPWEWAAGGRLL